LKDAVFLKRGYAEGIIPLSKEDAETILRHLIAKNPEFGNVWPDAAISRVNQTNLPIPDIDVEAMEGHRRLVVHLKIERNRSLIDKKKRNVMARRGALACEVCGFDFMKTYGVIGEGVCEVHHTTPLSKLSSAQKTTLKDLAIVCSNCHRMIHRHKPVLGISQLKRIVRRRALGQREKSK
jgi:predicted HNH restriction endonuclease